MFLRFVLKLLVLSLLQACSTNSYSIKSYKATIKVLESKYKFDRGDLVITYDLANIDNSGRVYFAKLGIISNEKDYIPKYLNNFKARYKSKRYLTTEARKKIKKMASLLDRLQVKHNILSKSGAKYVKKIAKINSKKINIKSVLSNLDHIIAYVPVMLPACNACLTSGYGRRKHPMNGKYKFHCGTDLVSRKKAPIYSSAHGRVKFVGKQNGYGNIIEIDHGNKIITKYAHLSKILVKKGHKVIRGQAIGIQGNTGNVKGEHLHFEVNLSGKHVNPYDFIGHNL